MGGILKKTTLFLCLAALPAGAEDLNGLFGRQIDSSRGAQGDQKGQGGQYGGGGGGAGGAQIKAEYKSKLQEITQKFEQTGSKIREEAKAQYETVMKDTAQIVKDGSETISTQAKAAQEEASKTTNEFLATLTASISAGDKKFASTGSADKYAKAMAELIIASSKQQISSLKLTAQTMQATLIPKPVVQKAPPPSTLVTNIQSTGESAGLGVNEYANPFVAAMVLRLKKDADDAAAGKKVGSFLPPTLQTQDQAGRTPGNAHFGHSHGGGVSSH